MALVFDHMQAKHRIMVEALRGGWTADAADDLIQQIGQEAERMAALLRDPTQARVAWVTLPEQMAVDETADALTWLSGHGMTVDTVLVNRVTLPPPRPCRWCQGRRRIERAAVERLRRGASGRSLILIPAAAREPRGVTALDAIGRAIDAIGAAARSAPVAPRAGVTASLPASLRVSAPPALVDAAHAAGDVRRQGRRRQDDLRRRRGGDAGGRRSPTDACCCCRRTRRIHSAMSSALP